MTDPLEIFVLAWIFFVGGTVGSFLNVVILRIPAGISIAASGSRCPRCLHAIRARDNIPIIGWLRLRGRCRDCGLPISPRYPLVELLIAVLFALLAWLGPLANGSNVPWPDPLQAPWQERDPWLLWTVFGLQVFFLCSLFSMAVIQWDGHYVPAKILLPTVLLALIAAFVQPEVHPLTLDPLFRLNDRWSSLGTGLAGGLMGGLLVWTTLPLYLKLSPAKQSSAAVLGLGFTGGFLWGWQWVTAWWLVLTLVTVVATPLVDRIWGRRAGWLSAGFLLAWIMLACWEPLTRWQPLLGSRADGFFLVTSLIVLVGLTWAGTPWLLRRVPPSRPSTPTPEAATMPTDPLENEQAILSSSSYRLAFMDPDFLQKEELRPVRLQLELLKPEIEFDAEGIESTIVVFGGTQVVERPEAERRLHEAQEALQGNPGDAALQRRVSRAERILAKSQYYDEAREFSALVSKQCQDDRHCELVIITGGGPGIMEAANRGAFEIGAKSAGLNIILPAEQHPNPYITPELCFQFHYFAIRKMHFLMRARGLVVFPGGFGTLDELFCTLTLRQTKRMQEIPIILYGSEYWKQVIDFQFLADESVIADEHLDLIQYVDSPQQAWEVIQEFERRTH